MATGLKPDPAEIRRAVRVLYGELGSNTIAEIRATDAPFGFNGTVRRPSGYFSDEAAFVSAAVSINTKHGGGTVYCTLNRVRRELLARSANGLLEKPKATTTDEQIERRLWLLVDADPHRPSGISASDDEKLCARRKVKEVRRYLVEDLVWPEPVLADSGNGYHLLFRIDLPTADDGLVHRCLAALDARFSDDQVGIDTTVANPARIVKVYGTVAMKGSHVGERPHRLSRILVEPVEGQPYGGAQIVPTELLEQLAAELPDEPRETPKAAATPGKSRQAPDAEPQGWLPAWIAKHELNVGRPRRWSNGGWKWVLETCLFCGESDSSAVILLHASGAPGFVCQHNRCTGMDWWALKAKLGLDSEALTRSQKSLRGVLSAHELNHPAGWRWVGAAASRHGVIDLARAVCPEEFRPDFDQGVQDRQEGRKQPRLHPEERVVKQARRAVEGLAKADKQGGEDEDLLAGLEIVAIRHKRRARGAGGSFDLFLRFDDQEELISGLAGKDLRSYSVVQSRALESGLLIPHVPPKLGPNRLWGEMLAPVFRSNKRKVVNLPEVGELGVAIEESLMRLLAGGDRGETADDLTAGCLVMVDRDDQVIPAGESTAQGYYLVSTETAHKHVRAELADEAPKRADIANAVVGLGGSYRGGTGGKGFVFADRRERAVYALPVGLALNPEAAREPVST